MRRFAFILSFIAWSLYAHADHITGGEMYYVYTGSANGQAFYDITLKLFMRCNSGRQFPDPAIISVFERITFNRVRDVSNPISRRETLRLTNTDPCITDPPPVCYEVAYYQFSIVLPISTTGYILSSEVNYRIRGISNLDGSLVGATYTCEIPGSISLGNVFANTSAAFTGSDLVVVCAGNYFSYSFAARDQDGDQLRYAFCPAYASSSSGVNGVPAGKPPYSSVPYNQSGFSGQSPLGDKVKIDAQTGLITGIAPAEGVYVVTVCVEEIRNNAVIAVQRKDLQINITGCKVASALLEDDYMLCGNSRSISIHNKSSSPLIVSYDWEVLSPSGNPIFSSARDTLHYTFSSNGTYTVRLTVNRNGQCTDSTSSKVFVYPGLEPDFSFSGVCINRETSFLDQSTTVSGSVNGWSWDFGELGLQTDISTFRNPSFHYPTVGNKVVQLIVTTTDGCRDTVLKPITLIDKTPIQLAFRDTLICVNDILQLKANGAGTYSWTPVLNMTGANTATPTVNPGSTRTYYVQVEYEGCSNTDSVKVNVVDKVTLQVMNDTTICSRDTVLLRISSDGLQYAWTPANQVRNPLEKTPWAITPFTTDYRVTSVIGGCSASASIRVKAVPYPQAAAGRDTIICFDTEASLHAVTDGNNWAWSPAGSLDFSSSLDPVAYPSQTTDYVFTAFANLGCPKPGRDTVRVTVLPRIMASAGNDTAVVVGQALQLMATGGSNYLWEPAWNLSSSTVPNPVATFTEPLEQIRYRVRVSNIAGCSDSAFVNIKVFATPPSVFVPTAFTPNGDGLNDLLRPIAAGIQSMQYFRVYNRWGQLVFSTTTSGHGWDGRVNGQYQNNNTYVWVVKAIDYNGNPYFKKGTVTLIR